MEERLIVVLKDIHQELERIARTLVELVGVQRTEPLDKIIHPSSRREHFTTDNDQ